MRNLGVCDISFYKLSYEVFSPDFLNQHAVRQVIQLKQIYTKLVEFVSGLKPKSCIVILLVIGIVLLLTVTTYQRISEINKTNSQQEKYVEVPVPVYVESVSERGIRDWVYGSGTARAVRREFLSFDTTGKVVYIKQKDGADIRVGDRVGGPSDEHPEGELLAKLDDRTQQADLAVAEANLRAAQASIASAQANLNATMEMLSCKSTLLQTLLLKITG